MIPRTTKRTRRRSHRRPGRMRSGLLVVAAIGLAVMASDEWRGWVDGIIGGGSTPGADQVPITGMARIIDGDTLHLHDTRIRLFGIDAPEERQTCRIGGADRACGEEATIALRRHVGGDPVTCRHRDTDRYGRMVAECFARGENLNAWMVRQGWAVAYRRYGGGMFDAEEAAARAARQGIWAGEFVMPWDWRQGAR